MIPIAITLGFSGPRKWSDTPEEIGDTKQAIDKQVEDWLSQRLNSLSGELDLQPSVFFCGVSQLAVGADMAFTRSCKLLNIPQRVLLPQHRDAYFDASEPDGSPDFTNQEKAEALLLLESTHIIEDRLASSAPNRRLRFEETNAELVRQSDFLICLVLQGAVARTGGTRDVVAKAQRAGKPLLLVTINVMGGRTQFRDEWVGDPGSVKKRFDASPLPDDLCKLGIQEIQSPDGFPCGNQCLRKVMEHTEDLAGRHSRFFRSAAVVIVATHCLATVCAAAAMKVHVEALLLGLLGLEILLLTTGYLVHHHLHHRAAAPRWALHRLMSELCRSIISLKGCHLTLGHLHALPLPEAARPFVQTMEVLHLRASRGPTPKDWEQFRNDYIAERIDGQIEFYRREADKATRRRSKAQQIFVWSSLLAILCTVLKVAFVSTHLLTAGEALDGWNAIFGFLAVILPVFAVGALSLAAANDLDGRSRSFEEMFRFLTQQQNRIMSAASRVEVIRLVVEAESRLVGETVNWFSRRSFTGVA